MVSPLQSISPSLLNAMTPHTAQKRFPLEPSTSTPQKEAIDKTESSIWLESPSSPFLKDIDQENEPPRGHNFGRREITSSVKKRAGFQIYDSDGREMGMTQNEYIEESSALVSTKTVLAPLKLANSIISPIKLGPALRQDLVGSMDDRLVEHEVSLQTENELHDTSSSTATEEANVDDTCFTAFSEIPNADMTQFAKLGTSSPSKSGLGDMVRYAAHDSFKGNANKS
jgi:hypothetical protein